MRKTALLTGVAGLLLMTAPAFAQDGTAPQTPAPSSTPQDAAPPRSLTLQPGATVKGSDGAVLGQLEGARNGPGGQELTVRGADGQLRAIPVSGGVTQQGADISVGWSGSQFQAAPPIADPAQAAEPATPATPAVPGQPGEPATPAQPATPATPAEPAATPDASNPPPGEATPTPETAPPPAEPTTAPDAASPPADETEPTPTEPADPAQTRKPMTPDQPGA